MYTHTRSSLLSSLTCIHTYVHTNVHLCVRRYIDDFDTLIRILYIYRHIDTLEQTHACTRTDVAHTHTLIIYIHTHRHRHRHYIFVGAEMQMHTPVLDFGDIATVGCWMQVEAL